MNPSSKLLAQCETYLQFVNKGDVSDERSEAHNAMMDTMRAEGFEFVNRDDARELAIQLVRKVKMTIKPNDLIRSVLGCGIVLNVFPGAADDGDALALIYWVRNVYKGQPAERIPVSWLKDIEPATKDDIGKELNDRYNQLMDERNKFTQAIRGAE